MARVGADTAQCAWVHKSFLWSHHHPEKAYPVLWCDAINLAALGSYINEGIVAEHPKISAGSTGTSALRLPLHANLMLLAQCGRGLLRQAVQACKSGRIRTGVSITLKPADR